MTREQHHVFPGPLDVIGILGGLFFVAIILCVVLYIFIEIVTGGREEKKANDELEEYVDEIQQGHFYNQEEDVK